MKSDFYRVVGLSQCVGKLRGIFPNTSDTVFDNCIISNTSGLYSLTSGLFLMLHKQWDIMCAVKSI